MRTEPVVLLLATWLLAAVLHWQPSGVTPIAGVYPGSDLGSCCWLAGSAEFRVRQPQNTDTLLIELFTPEYAAANPPASIAASIDGGPAVTRCCIRAGLSEFAFPLVAKSADRADVVRVRLSHTFVPAVVLGNGDSRTLSVLLRGVVFENSKTGMRYGAMVPARAPFVPPALNLLAILLSCLLAFSLTWRRPIYGLIALVVCDPFDFTVAFGATTLTLPKAILIVVALGLLRHLRGIRAGSVFWIPFAAGAAMVVSMAISSFDATARIAAERETLKAVQYLASFAVAYAAFRLDPDDDAIRGAFTAAIAAVSALSLLQVLTGIPEPSTAVVHHMTIRRFAGPLEGPNQLAAFYGLTLTVVVALWAQRPPSRFELATFAAGAAATMLTFSRGGIVAGVLGVVAVIALRRGRSMRAVLGVLAPAFLFVLAITFAAAAGALPGADRIFGAADETRGGLGTRTLLWHTAVELWKTHPLLGVGPGNFEVYALRIAGVHTHANSVYVHTLAEQGALGELVLLALVSAVVFALCKRPRTALAIGAFGATVTLVFHQLVDTLWIYPKDGVMWWLILALAAASLDQQHVINLPADAAEVDATGDTRGHIADL